MSYTAVHARAWVARIAICICASLVGAALFDTAPVSGQDTHAIRGIVTDDGGRGIADVTIGIEGTSIRAITDATGAFVISRMNPGTYRLRAERIGYETAQVQYAVPGDATVSIVLVTRAIEVGGVTIIGSGREAQEVRERMRENPGSVTTIEPQAIRATRQANLPDVLRFVPGVFAQPRFGAADEAQLSIRGSGLRNNFHLRGVNILINGMPYRNADGFTDFESLELLTAQSIHVYKAANAFRFGGSTLGGAIDIETKTGYTAEKINVNAEAGAYGFLKSQLSSGGSHGAFDYYASYARTQLDGYRAWTGQERDRINLHAGYVLSPAVDARAFYLFADIQEQLPGSLTRAEFETDPRGAAPANLQNRWGRDYKLHHVGAQIRTQLGATQRLDIAPYLQYRDIVHPIFRLIDQISRDAGVEARYENSSRIGGNDNRMSIGVQYALGNVDDKAFDNVGGTSGAMRKDQLDEAGTTSLFVEDLFAITPRLSVVAGMRWASSLRRLEDRFLSDGDQSDSRTFTAFTPRFGVLYDLPAVSGQIYANASRTSEPPLLLELNSLAVAGFVDIDAQDATQVEVGTRGAAHGWAWDAAVYAIDVRNEILNTNVQPFPGAPFTVPAYRNAARTNHSGIEVGVERAIATGIFAARNGGDKLTARASYAYNRFRFVEDAEFGGNAIPGAPEHALDGELTYRHPSGVTVRPAIQWIAGDYFVNSANTVKNDGWITLSARGELLMPRLNGRVFVEVRNITDRVYSGAVTVDDAAGRSFLPADRRSVSAGFQWQQ